MPYDPFIPSFTSPCSNHTSSSIPNCTELPPVPVEVDSELEYKIARILDTKIDKHRHCKLLYLVKWLRYEGTDEETSWLPADELNHVPDLVEFFHQCYPTNQVLHDLFRMSLILYFLFLFLSLLV